MKTRIHASILVAIWFIAFAVWQAQAQFRNCTFGMSEEQILSEEESLFVSSNPLAIIYKDQIFGFDTLVAYHFSPDTDQFILGSYCIDVVGYEIEEILDHYVEVVEALDDKHGKSMKSDAMWWNPSSSYKDDLINAFRFGDVSFRKEWYGPGVRVTLNLSNELNKTGEIVYRINYEPGRRYDPVVDLSKL